MAERTESEVREFLARWPTAAKTVRSRLVRRGLNSADVDDILQDVALRLFRSAPRGNDEHHFEAMAWDTAKWALADRLRASRSEGIRVDTEVLELVGPHEESGMAIRVDFAKAWNRLTAREQRVLELRTDGHADADIASELQVSEPAVRTIARRARLKLADDLL